MIQISYKDRNFIIEEMTEEDKEILQAEKPELYSKFEKHFKEEKNKNLQAWELRERSELPCL